MAKPALEIVIGKLGKKGQEPAGDGEAPEGMADDEDGEAVTSQAKSEAFAKLMTALGIEPDDESAAMQALEEFLYHCEG